MLELPEARKVTSGVHVVNRTLDTLQYLKLPAKSARYHEIFGLEAITGRIKLYRIDGACANTS